MKFNDSSIEKRLIEQVTEMLFDKGIKGWNMDQISERAGIAKNTLYRMIGSKEELIEKVVLGYIKSIQLRMVEIINAESDYLHTLEQVTQVFPELLGSIYADTFREVFIEYPRIEKSVRTHKDEMTKNIIMFLQKGIELGILRNNIKPEYVFELFQANVLFLIKSGYKGEEIRIRLMEIFRYVVYGIRII